MNFTFFSRAASGFLLVSLAGSLACSEGDARESSMSRNSAKDSLAQAPREPVDSAILLARAATERWQQLCESDSVAIQHRAAVAAADRAA
ncbi:MAG TPA: hypothetical protein VIQ60_05060, partial [Gemmatimonadaceae bacterium]